MKKHQVKEHGTPDPESGPDLHFTRILHGDGHLEALALQPGDWETVTHLYDDIFLAEGGGDCVVFVGEYK